MPSTPESARMAEIVAFSAPMLKQAGFRKRRHSFNRCTAAGLVHVVNFWQAPREPPAWAEIPGLRERLFGTFRVDFGVFVPEMTRMGVPASNWVNEYNCHLRMTIGELMGAQGDLWVSLAEPQADEWALESLTSFGLPWLDRFPDHQHVFDAFMDNGFEGVGMHPAAPLDIAEMLTAIGRAVEARALLEEYASQPNLGNHADYLAEYLPKIGHADLIERIRR